MHRRGVLRMLGLAVAGLAGCASGETDRGEPPTRPAPAEPTPTSTPPQTPTPTPTPERFVDGLQTAISSVDVTESGNGHPQALVPVENTTDRSLDATLSVTIQGSGQQYAADTSISVPAGESREYSVTFDVAWSTVDPGPDRDPTVREVFLYNPAYRS